VALAVVPALVLGAVSFLSCHGWMWLLMGSPTVADEVVIC
jgi:hypothetical protein